MGINGIIRRRDVFKKKRTYQIFDAQNDLLLDTDDFSKAVRKAKATQNSSIRVKGAYANEFECRQFEFEFRSPSPNTTDETIKNYVELRVDDEIQKLLEMPA